MRNPAALRRTNITCHAFVPFSGVHLEAEIMITEQQNPGSF